MPFSQNLNAGYAVCSRGSVIGPAEQAPPTEGNSERNYQPDRQDGRKYAKGDDSNFEMKIII